MTINLADNSPRISYAVAEGVTQTSFTVPFEFFQDADLNVYVDNTLKTLTTDYTVTGGDGSTGSITISVTGASGGSTVVITRDIDLERTTDFPSSGPFDVASLNTELDKVIAIAADLEDEVNRSLRLTDYDSAVSLVLPDVNTRKGKVLAFNGTTGAVESGPSVSDTQSVADASADIALLADIQDGTTATNAITDVASNATDISTVAGVSAAVSTNATNIAAINTNASNITDIQNASANAASALASKNAAATSEANAATSETNAASSATAAASSATSAASSASAAASSEASVSADAATATTKAAEASTSAANASTSETNSAASAASASTSASNAATSESNAASSASSASTSASSAASSATAAAASAAAAATAFDNFDDIYLGAKASNPSVDNDGDPLTSGDLYFNTTDNQMKAYDGAQWISASATSQASLILYEYTATSGQVTFSGADDNGATLGYTADNIIVVMNGVTLDPSDYTATNGTSVVLASGAALNDIVNIYAFQSFSVADTVSASAGGTFSANVAINGDLTVDTNSLYVDSANNRIGIGTTTPDRNIHITDAEPSIVLENSGQGTDLKTWRMYSNSSSLQIGTVDDAFASGQNALEIGRDNTDNITSIQFKTGASSERMRIDSSGNVGIGTTTPNKVLHLETSGETVQRMVAATNNLAGFYFGDSGSGSIGQLIYDNYSDDMRFNTNGAERMRITSAGNVGIGTTSIDSKLFTIGDSGSWVYKCFSAGSGAQNLIAFNLSSGGSAVGSITSNGSSTSYNTTSDHRLKENVTQVTGAADRIKALNPVRFNFIADPDKTVDGFLAHEVADVVPEAVTGTKDAMRDEEYEVTPAVEATYDDEGNVLTEAVPAVIGTRSVPDYQGIDQSKLVPLLTAALQEALTKIDDLENRIAALEIA